MAATDPKKLRSRRAGSSDSDGGPYLSLELGNMGGDVGHVDSRGRLDSETDYTVGKGADVVDVLDVLPGPG
jgi:hypothetical protein